jgi:branched-chain amino acid transport system substrate-binding protein
MACAETPACAQAAAVYETVAPAEGVEYKGAQTVAAADPNYSAQCLALKDSGADAVALFVGAGTAIRIAQDCAAQDYHPVWVGSTVDKSFPSVAEFDGMVGYALTAPWFLAETPEQQLFQDVVASTIDDLSSTSEQYGKTTAITWAGLRLFQKAAEAATAGGDDLTSESLTEAIKAIPVADSTLDGFIGEVDYSRPSTQQGACYYVIALEGGEWTAPSGGEPVCLP